MATIDKKSVRNEFDSIKNEFNNLSADKKIPSECKALFKSLILLFELILSIFLEKKTKKTSTNSGKPSSQTEEDKSSLGNKGSKGKGKKENAGLADNTRTVETVEIIAATTCNACGESLDDVECKCYERRTRIDIIFEKTVEHVDAEIKECPNCDATVKAQHPEDLHGPLQYGNGLKAYIIQLLITQMISLNRVQKLLKTIIGNLISEATLLGYVMRLHFALEGWEQRATASILMAPCINADETSLRVDKKNQWIHVYSAGDITLKYLHKRRGKEAMNDIGIIPRYGGTVIHDCWSSYLSYENCSHGLCGSHLLRELAFIHESNAYVWAINMKKLLQEACKMVSCSKKKRLTKRQYARLQRRYRNLLTRGEKELPEIPAKKTGQRGKIAKSDAHNLWERLRNHEPAVLLFAKDPHVSFTNNRAERDLRMSKVKQKVSGCFRVEKYAHAYCRISSYLQTMANKGINPLIAIQMALAGKFE
jgi:transposase